MLVSLLSGRSGLGSFSLSLGVPLGQVPRLDDPALRLVDVALVLDLADADAHAVAGEDDVLAAHAARGRGADGAAGEVDLVGDPGGDGDDGEGEEEGKEFAISYTLLKSDSRWFKL